MPINKPSATRWIAVIVAVSVPAVTFIWYLSGVSATVSHNNKSIRENRQDISALNRAVTKEKSQLAVIEERTGSIKEAVNMILVDIKELRKR